MIYDCIHINVFKQKLFSCYTSTWRCPNMVIDHITLCMLILNTCNYSLMVCHTFCQP